MRPTSLNLFMNMQPGGEPPTQTFTGVGLAIEALSNAACIGTRQPHLELDVGMNHCSPTSLAAWQRQTGRHGPSVAMTRDCIGSACARPCHFSVFSPNWVRHRWKRLLHKSAWLVESWPVCLSLFILVSIGDTALKYKKIRTTKELNICCWCSFIALWHWKRS